MNLSGVVRVWVFRSNGSVIFLYVEFVNKCRGVVENHFHSLFIVWCSGVSRAIWSLIYYCLFIGEGANNFTI